MRELSRTDKIVGPVQSVCSGHMPAEIFLKNMKLKNFAPPEDFLNCVVAQLKAIRDRW